MAVAQLDVANSALIMLGEPTVAALNDGSKASNTFNTLWLNSILTPVLEAYPWKALKVRANLFQPTVPIIAGTYASATNTVTLTMATSYTVTAASWTANTATFTVGAHTMQIGMSLTVSGVTPTGYNGNFTITATTGTTFSVAMTTNPGAWSSGGTVTFTLPVLNVGQSITVTGIVNADWNGTFTVTAATSNTFSYIQNTVDAYVSGGYVAWSPTFGPRYIYTLPTDCIRAIKVNSISVSNFYNFYNYQYRQTGTQMPPFTIESGFLLSDESAVSLQYIQLQNPPQDGLLVDLLATKAAVEMCLGLNRDENIKTRIEATYEKKLARYKFLNSQQGTPEQFQESDWIVARQ